MDAVETERQTEPGVGRIGTDMRGVGAKTDTQRAASPFHHPLPFPSTPHPADLPPPAHARLPHGAPGGGEGEAERDEQCTSRQYPALS